MANIEVKVDEEGLLKKGFKEEENEFNLPLNYAEIKKLANDEVGKVVDTDKMDITFDTKIFQHSDEERRVTYEHIRSFYQAAKK